MILRMGLLDSLRRRRDEHVVTDLSTGRYHQEVVGESHYQREIEQAAEGAERGPDGRPVTRVLVLREPNNRHDRNAVKILDLAGRTFGYLPRSAAAELNEALAGLEARREPASCMAVIAGGGDRSFGVWLDLDDRELLYGDV